MLNLDVIDRSWTLFLDRDGVINREKQGGYICTPQELVFCGGALAAMRLLAKRFHRIIVVTNQRGIGKGLMSEQDLEKIHQHMSAALTEAGGRVDRIYHCSAVDNSHPCRKPQPGMASQAHADYPDIIFSRAIMVGNSMSDMAFGRNAGMHTVFVRTTSPGQDASHPSIDLVCNDLADFANALARSGHDLDASRLPVTARS